MNTRQKIFLYVSVHHCDEIEFSAIAICVQEHTGFQYTQVKLTKISSIETLLNQRLPGACNRSPGSKLLSITTQLHYGGHLGGRAQLPDTILEEDHPMTIPSNLVLIELLVPD